MFRAHNSIKVCYDGLEQVMPNEVIDVKSYLLQDVPFADYIMANGKTEKSKLESINSDIVKGMLYAEYSAVFDKSEYDGKEFSQFGLSADGKNLVNSANFAPIVKESGKTVRVSITVFLELEDGSANLILGGKNPLCEFLLGARSLGNNVGFVADTCNIQNSNIIRAIDKTAIKKADLKFDNGRISFCAIAPKAVPEIIFTIDQKPVLRAYAYETIPAVKSGMGTVRDDCTINLGYADVTQVGSMMIGFINVAGGEVIHTFDRIIEAEHLYGFGFGQGTKIKSDIFKRYAAVLNDKEAYFFDSVKGVPKLLYRLVLEAGFRGFDVCEGGYLALYYDKLKLYDKYKTEKSIDGIACGDENFMFCEGSHFFYATRTKGAKLQTYRLTPPAFTKLAELDITGGKIFRSFFNLAVLDSAANSYFVGSGSLLATPDTRLSNLCKNADEAMLAGGLICTVKNNAATVTAEDFSVAKTFAAGTVLKAVGDYFVSQDSGGNQSIIYFDRAKRCIAEVGGLGKVGINSINGIAAIGNYILVNDNDSKIKTFYRNKSGSYAYYGGYTKGAQAIFVVQINDGESFGENIKTSIFIDIKK